MDRSEASALIQEKILALPVPKQLKFTLYERALQEVMYLDESGLTEKEKAARLEEERHAWDPRITGLIIPAFVIRGPYAIRNSDLNLLLILSTSLNGMSIYTSLSTTGERALAVQIANAIVQVLMIARNLREKIVPLTDDECPAVAVPEGNGCFGARSNNGCDERYLSAGALYDRPR